MSDEYQLRKDVDRFKKFLDQLESSISSKLDIDDFTISSWLDNYYTSGDIDTLLSNLVENIDEKIDTDTITEELRHKVDELELTTQVATLNTSISGKADKVHTHGWVGMILNKWITLYVNETLGLCELKFAKEFASAQGDTYYRWHNNIVPQKYRPVGNAFGAMNYGSVLRVQADGSVGGYFPRAMPNRFTGLGSVMWHYGVNMIPSNWYNYNNLIVNESDNQIQISNTGSSWGGYFANKTGTSASSISDVIDWDSPFRVELDIVTFTGNAYLQIYDGTSILQKHLSTDLNLRNNNHIIINSDAETVIWDVDDELVVTDEVALGTSRIGFRLNANASVTFKNFNIEQ
ncbi:hypothetical protein [Methanobrevibacter sp.]